MAKYVIYAIFFVTLLIPASSYAHRSGCHRWHSCPSDTGSYICGDLGYPCKYPTYSNVTGQSYSTYNLITPIRKGGRGVRIIMLQQTLSADPSIYPEGLATGYFGSATKRAVERFQRLYGLAPDGVVGLNTMVKIKEVYGVDLSQ